MISRHPDGVSLSAWYDGELVDPRIAAHVERCERCWGRVRSFAAVDDAVRGTATIELGRSRPTRSRRAVAVAAFALAVVLVAVNMPDGRDPVPTREVSAAVAEPGRPAGVDATDAGPPTDGRGTADVAAPTTSAVPAASAPTEPSVLGIPLPGGDPSASPVAAEVWAAARAAAAPFGHVAVVPVDAGEPAPAHVDAIVGGWGAGEWDTPALVRVSGGPVVPGDPDPRTAGRLLAAAVTEAGSVIGVIEAAGPDAAFGDGVADARRTTTTDLVAGSSCEREVRAALARGASALAIAAPPPSVRACLSALVSSGFRPPAGVLVPPSAALDPSPLPAGLDVLAAVGLPAPGSDHPGATRVRRATGVHSYRALLTFAGVELAAGVTAGAGRFADAWRTPLSWQSDLLRVEDGRNLAVHALRASAGEWHDGSDRGFWDGQSGSSRE